MKIYTENSEFIKDKIRIATVGTFDGVHQGHLNILDLLLAESNDEYKKSILITFDPHPRTVISEEYKIQLLTALKEKELPQQY